MVHAQFDPTIREELAIAAVQAKIAKDLSWQQIADAAGYSPAFVTAAVLGQHPLPPQAADTVAGLLGLGDDAALLLQTIPTRGSIPAGVPTDPTIYRFYEMLQVYGTTLKALIHEQFGDGIISAINFKLDVRKVPDPDGGYRAVIPSMASTCRRCPSDRPPIFQPHIRNTMDFAQRTIDLARRNVEEGGRPFATIIVKDGAVLAESPNRVAQTNDPTAHAEILAIREACTKLGTEHLAGSTIYILALPCPMCLGALYYCSPDEVVFLTTRDAYQPHYVDDRKYFELNTFYDEFAKPWDRRRLPMHYQARDDAVDVYRLWQERNGGNRHVAGAPTAT
ncbi:Probable cytidine/deoxycytidylate deaminase [Mycobacteroides abscessus]|nr:Probable cytidine/deoxycytidylate deaminase [Mycobacteroides abscessus]